MKPRGNEAAGKRAGENWADRPGDRELLKPEYVMLEAIDIANSALFGSEKAFSMLEDLEIPIEYRAKVAVLMRLFEEIEERARKIFNSYLKTKTAEV